MVRRLTKAGSKLVLVAAIAVVLAGCGQETAVSTDTASSGTDAGSETMGTPIAEPVTATSTSADATSITSDATSSDATSATLDTTTSVPSASGEETSETTGSNSSVDLTSCVTVPTTIPGQSFCDGYDPTPTSSSADSRCPDWATEKVDRPAGGWLGADGSTGTDRLSRRSVDDIAGYGPLDDYATRVAGASPPGFVVASSYARANSACVEESLFLSVSAEGPDESRLGVFTTRLLGQIDWFEEGYPPTNHEIAADGTELAWYDGSTVAKVWAVSPDGVLTKAYAYGANADTRFGFPTTTTMFGTTEPALDLTITVDDLKAMVRALTS